MTEKVNGEGMTFAEWDAAARLGEERKVAPIASERVDAIRAATALGGEDPAEYAAAPRPLPRRTA